MVGHSITDSGNNEPLFFNIGRLTIMGGTMSLGEAPNVYGLENSGGASMTLTVVNVLNSTLQQTNSSGSSPDCVVLSGSGNATIANSNLFATSPTAVAIDALALTGPLVFNDNDVIGIVEIPSSSGAPGGGGI